MVAHVLVPRQQTPLGGRGGCRGKKLKTENRCIRASEALFVSGGCRTSLVVQI